MSSVVVKMILIASSDI